jgi:hypothetical protein
MKYSKATAAFLLTAAFLISGAAAQTLFAQQAETLFDGNVSHGGFGGPVVQIGDVAGTTGVWVGGRGGWIINLDENHAISLGGGGYGLVTNHRVPVPFDGNDELYAMGGYGGFIFEYTNHSYRLIHLTATTLIGGGGLMLRERDFDDVLDDVDSYFVLEPGIQAELNVTRFFRIAAGASYRFTSGISSFGYTDKDFSGLNGVITFKFGGFL